MKNNINVSFRDKDKFKLQSQEYTLIEPALETHKDKLKEYHEEILRYLYKSERE